GRRSGQWPDQQDVDLGSVLDAPLAGRDHRDRVGARPGGDLHAALLPARFEYELRSIRADPTAGKEGESLDAGEGAAQARLRARTVGIPIAGEKTDREAHEQLEPQRGRRGI